MLNVGVTPARIAGGKKLWVVLDTHILVTWIRWRGLTAPAIHSGMTALLIFPQIGYSLSCGYTNHSAAAKLKNTIFTHKKVLNRLFPAQNDAEKIKQRIVASSAAIPNLTPKKG